MYTGYSQSQRLTGSPQSQSSALSSGSKAKRSLLKVDTSIGKLSLDSQQSSHFEEVNNSFVTPLTASPPDLSLPRPMCGRNQPVSPVASLNLERSPSIRQAKRIGKWFGKPQSLVESWTFPLTYEYKIIGPSGQLVVTTRALLRLFESLMSSGVYLVLANQGGPGKKLVYCLTVKVQDLSSGMAIKVKNMLYSMNFVEESMFHTCSDGSTGTLVEWRSRDPQCLCL